MRAYLMFQDRDYDLQQQPPSNSNDLIQDLEMDRLFEAMAREDAFLKDVARHAILTSLRVPQDIHYRQSILSDCLAQEETVRETYLLAVEAIEREKRVWGSVFGKYPEGALHRSVEVLEIFFGLLKRLRIIADSRATAFRSQGFKRFLGMISEELNDEFLAAVSKHLRLLKFRGGVRLSAELGEANKAARYVLRMPPELRRGWRERLRKLLEQLSLRKEQRLFYEVSSRDESGQRAISELRERGISDVAIALAQSTDHILNFFKMLRSELGFYVGCLNLRARLTAKGEPICFPQLLGGQGGTLSAKGLYDVCLSLSLPERVVGNDFHADAVPLVMITGANRGGKSTFLRSVGLSQLMMQSGMFVPAAKCEGSLCDGVFTHFKREEDSSLRSGKLDEELKRMSGLVDQMSPDSMVLFNESFGSTNEREGSEIARQIVKALLDSRVRVYYVTHMFDLADSLYADATLLSLFLRAERLDDGSRTFRLVEGKPLPTSHGADLYDQIFERRS